MSLTKTQQRRYEEIKETQETVGSGVDFEVKGIAIKTLDALQSAGLIHYLILDMSDAGMKNIIMVGIDEDGKLRELRVKAAKAGAQAFKDGEKCQPGEPVIAMCKEAGVPIDFAITGIYSAWTDWHEENAKPVIKETDTIKDITVDKFTPAIYEQAAVRITRDQEFGTDDVLQTREGDTVRVVTKKRNLYPEYEGKEISREDDPHYLVDYVHKVRREYIPWYQLQCIHPEIEREEICLGNYTEEDGRKLPYKSKRMGWITVDIYGNRIPYPEGLKPWFANTEEFKKHMGYEL